MGEEPEIVKDLIDAGWYCSRPELADDHQWVAWLPWDRREQWEQLRRRLALTLTPTHRDAGVLTRGSHTLPVHLIATREDRCVSIAHAVVTYDDNAGTLMSASSGRQAAVSLTEPSMGLAELSRRWALDPTRNTSAYRNHVRFFEQAAAQFLATGTFWGPRAAVSDVTETLATLLSDADVEHFSGMARGHQLLEVLLSDPGMLTAARLLTDPSRQAGETAGEPAALASPETRRAVVHARNVPDQPHRNDGTAVRA
jgi:hypothetical protein